MNRNSFPDAAAAAFGRGPRVSSPSDVPVSRSGFSDAASSAFGSRQQRPASNFSDAFGRGGSNGFDAAASAAFGKKPARRDETPSGPPPARSNSFGYILNQALGDSPSASRTYGGSALAVQRRKAEEAEKAKKADISNPDAFPTLGGGAGSATPAPVTTTGKPTFAELMRKRAAEDAAAAEAQAAAEQIAAEERRKSSARSHTFVNAPRIHSSAPRTGRFGYGGEDEDEYEGGGTPPYGAEDFAPSDRNDYDDNVDDNEDAGEHNAHLFRGY